MNLVSQRTPAYYAARERAGRMLATAGGLLALALIVLYLALMVNLR